jgi:hypothetical protein
MIFESFLPGGSKTVMATSTRGRSIVATVARRSQPVVSKARFTELAERSKNAARRLRDATSEDTDAMLSIGAGVALGLYEKDGRKLPTLMGIDPAIAWGVGTYIVTRKSKSKAARMARQAAIGLATIGANRSIQRGTVKVSGDDDDDDDSDL